MEFPNRHRRSDRRGVTLIELLVASAVVALLATLTFPALQMIQQREKERRLKEILDNVRGSIFGTKSSQGQRRYTQGYRTYVVRQLYANAAGATDQERQTAAKNAIASGAANGLLYPAYPSSMFNHYGTTFDIASDGQTLGDPTKAIPITINKRFLRIIPPHPFIGWNPNVRWDFKAAAVTAGGPWFASGSWVVNNATGVVGFRSVGAGFGLDGTNTDDW